MKTATHGNGNGLDNLYVLPESEEERQQIWAFLQQTGRAFTMTRSDVEGQDWFGKQFFDVPFSQDIEPDLRAAVQ